MSFIISDRTWRNIVKRGFGWKCIFWSGIEKVHLVQENFQFKVSFERQALTVQTALIIFRVYIIKDTFNYFQILLNDRSFATLLLDNTDQLFNQIERLNVPEELKLRHFKHNLEN